MNSGCEKCDAGEQCDVQIVGELAVSQNVVHKVVRCGMVLNFQLTSDTWEHLRICITTLMSPVPPARVMLSVFSFRVNCILPWIIVACG